ncbi:THAP domain-containing protein 6-like isoform X2 [Schistocerca gregaria]|uniref:THAP domain-containing protein 6-like isoform X2 n=1 Tax=Schistocerca gregaria TaxID=7010 RepID=UPI00211F13E5|nr:THAP domain-containing protein 6-like isoform X2 [Schistocerca gregaria]
MHSFPKDAARRSLWIKALRRKDWESTQYSAVCSKHFREADIDRTSSSTIRLRDNGVSSIFSSFPQYLENIDQSTASTFSSTRKKTSSIQENDNRPPLSSSGHSHHVGIPLANGQRKLEHQNLSPSVVDIKTDFGDKLDCNPEVFLRDAPPLKPLIARAIAQSLYSFILGDN